MSDLKLKLP